MSRSPRILVVDGDAEFRRELADQLSLHEGFRVEEAESLREARELLRTRTFDALVLAARLPDGEGRALCRSLRAEGLRAPIFLVLDGADEPAGDRAEGAEVDGFVARPVRLAELMARLRARLGLAMWSEETSFPVGPYCFRPAQKMLVRGEERIRLTDKETALLEYLCRVGDRPVPRAVLLGEIWGYGAEVTTRTLETHIYRLRQKLEPEPGKHRLLVTEPEGYRLVRSG
ncbi:MAG: response regulator transcription factor [Geminicoccaceae bacterium]|nr:response regulator transcription factor [Geminicoccaceae bacterium]MCS7267286.1 response regulator transcription factor [Geminicoccaceae bacterium]MCX7630138.1 response regulator transcription factor [Geminicoccaceae bacterium]MDW8124814.1 response regulator transcription factor [Geminicoccaceae bacterium]MDW8340662.1 response regulator transcription factor [Geminicoccaceae bacterium]